MASNQGNTWEGANSVLDVRGWNYIGIGNTDTYHKDHPNQPIFGSEEASTQTDRGEYVDDPTNGYVRAFPGLGTTAESWWNYYEPRKYLAGAFIWTGFDYRGEPSPYGWPCISSHFGALDTCGFPKEIAYYYKAWWTSKPMVHVAPTWTWPGDEGKDKLVWIESNCDAVDLTLNGKDLGTKPVVKLHHLEWQVPYEPGTLRAVGLINGKAVCSDQEVTSGPLDHLVATPSTTSAVADGEHNIIVNIAADDANGNLVNESADMIHFSLSEGAASIIGVGNGDPSCHEPDVYIRQPLSHPITHWQMAAIPNGTQTTGMLPSSLHLDWKDTSVENDGYQIADSNTSALFRSDFELSDDQAKMKTLSIGQIDDEGDVYLNGHFLGHTDRWDQSYSFPVSEYLHSGKNELLVWVHNIGGRGGLGKGVQLASPGSAPDWKRSLFHGLCQVIIRVGTEPGSVVLHVSDENGKSTDVPIQLTAGHYIPYISG